MRVRNRDPRALLLALGLFALACPEPAFSQPIGCPNPTTSSCIRDDSILLDSGANLDEAIAAGTIGGSTGISADSPAGTTSGSPVSIVGSFGILTIRNGNQIEIRNGALAYAPAVGSYAPSATFGVCSLDNCAGVADGFSADPNPFPGDLSSVITYGVTVRDFPNPSYNLDPIHYLSVFNGPDGGPNENNNLYTSGLYWEYGFDAQQRSLRPLVEWNWDVAPNTHLISFSARTETISMGMNLTFSNGTICRPMNPYGAGTLANLRMFCLNHIPPASGNTIMACTGPASTAACSPALTGTVSGTAIDEEVTGLYRPFAAVWYTSENATDFRLRFRPGLSGLHINGLANTIRLGHGDGESSFGRVLIPGWSGGTSYLLVAGDIQVDTTNSTTWGGQFGWHDGTAARVISPTKTDCKPYTASGTTFADEVVDFASYHPVTVIALGARNNSAGTSSATFTLERLTGGAPIALAGTLTASGNDDDMPFATTTDPDAALPSGAGLRFDAADVVALSKYELCVAYRDTPQ